MVDVIQAEQPKIETEIKLGNTIYIVGGFFASSGVTVSEKIKKLLDKETKKSVSKNAEICVFT